MSPSDGSTPRQNGLLAALPSAELERLLPDLEFVQLSLGEVIYETGSQQRFLYFLTSGIVSALYVMENGASGELAVAGNEGAVGIAVFMGGAEMTTRAVVQSAGSAYRLQETIVKREFSGDGALQQQLLRYTQALITQIAQTAVCSRHHSIEQQLCRWLLFSMDRLSSNHLHITHELIANMLSVRRGGITEAAGKLQTADLIRCNRGHLTIVDRMGLEERACECYTVVKRAYDRLLGAEAAASISSSEHRWRGIG